MIDQLATLGKVNSIGRDGFVWWIGQVAHKDSWRETNKAISLRGYKGNRVKVRIVGYHPFDDEGNELPDEDLPWAEVLADPYTGNGQGGLSETLNLVGGEMAIGFFLDGEDAQQPMIMNLFPKYDNVVNTFKGTEMKSRKSSGFNAFEAYTRPRPGQPEGAPAHVVISEKENEEETKSKVDSNKIVSSTVNNKKKVILDSSNAKKKLEKDATTKTTATTPCKNDTIDKISGLVADFISVTRGLETDGLGSWADPLTNTIVDMQAELEFIKGEVSGIMRSTMNDMKNALMKKINKKFKKVISDLKLDDPKALFKEKGAKKAGKGILTLIACAFGDALGKIGDFIKNMFKNLLGKVINGAVCAVKEFTAGIFSKMFDVLEGALGTIMSGLNWLMGGFDSIKNVLRSASGIASKILGFLKGCDDEACAKPSEYASYIGAKFNAPDEYGDTIGKVNILSGISTALRNAGRGGGIRDAINDFMGTSDEDETPGGLTLFDDGDFLFPDCATTNANPTSQADITPSPPGFIYPNCIPPDYQVVGSGTGAELLIVVGNSRRIFSVEVINGGSGYGVDTQITIIDNTGNGHGANVKPIIKDGVIVETVILSAGSGYCRNTVSTDTTGTPISGIGTNVVGTVSNVHVVTPGVNYDPSDTITFEGIGDGTNIPIITTPSGSIVGVNFPPNILTEFETPPVLIVNSDTGSDASFIPIMSFKGQFKTDVDADKRKAAPLIGIDNVVDCIGDNRDPVGFVNGVEYSGPYHVMSSGLKMTGATHGVSDSIIYDTIEESLSNPVVSPSSYETPTETVTETPVETTTTTTSPTIVTTQTTPTTSMDTTTTSTPPDTSTGTDTSSSGGGGYGGY